jgi:uncharacterized protein (DUF1015 family)
MLVSPRWAERVVSPMLDAVSPDQHAALLATEEYSWLHVTAGADPRVRGDRPTGADALRALLDAGAFDPVPPGAYVYRITDPRGSHVGVVVAVEAAAFVTGHVRGHEAVQPERVAALLRHFGQVPARSELVALLRQPDPVVDEIVAKACAGTPALDFGSPDVLRQTVWRIDDGDLAGLTRRLGSPPLYVADGHHRVAAALRAWEEAGQPPDAGIGCVLYAPDGLRIEAFHRRVQGPVDTEWLFSALQSRFQVTETDGPEPAAGTFAVYGDARWLAVSAGVAPIGEAGGDRPEARSVHLTAGVAALDIARLHANVLQPLLGIERVDDPRLEVTPATEPLERPMARCDVDGGVLFVPAAPSVAQLVEVADRGQVMAAKSTFFEPKPQAGIFLHLEATA